MSPYALSDFPGDPCIHAVSRVIIGKFDVARSILSNPKFLVRILPDFSLSPQVRIIPIWHVEIINQRLRRSSGAWMTVNVVFEIALLVVRAKAHRHKRISYE